MNDISKALTDLQKYGQELIRRFSQRTKTAEVAKARVEAVVDNLVANNIISPESKAATASSLLDHSKCLLFIDKLAHNLANKDLGVPFSQTRKSSVAGGEPTIHRESDRVFDEILFRRRGNGSIFGK
jgi:hypothetical protein